MTKLNKMIYRCSFHIQKILSFFPTGNAVETRMKVRTHGAGSSVPIFALAEVTVTSGVVTEAVHLWEGEVGSKASVCRVHHVSRSWKNRVLPERELAEVCSATVKTCLTTATMVCPPKCSNFLVSVFYKAFWDDQDWNERNNLQLELPQEYPGMWRYLWGLFPPHPHCIWGG